MKRAFLSFVILSLLVPGCATKRDAVHSVTAATPKIPEAADASRWPEEPPEEDASAWPEEVPPGRAQGIVSVMGTSGSEAYIEAYTDKQSYLPGETIHFHVSTTAESYSIQILKEAWTREYVGKVTGIAGSYHPVPPPQERPWAEGAKWPVSYSWVVPEEWENGNYVALLRTTSGQYTYTYYPFIVRNRVAGSRSEVAFVMNYNTRNAYNRWGGKSLYYSGVSRDPHYAIAVSFLRPFDTSCGRGKHYWTQWEITSQLIADGFDPEFITEWDISSYPAILSAYDVIVFAGHHEYISRNTYDALEAHHHRGGHIAFFSANDIYWQVRFEDNGETMVSYKSYARYEDPMREVDSSLVTTLWAKEPLNRSAMVLQGVYYVPYSYCFEPEDFVVQDCNHFIFAGTGLRDGDPAGSKVAAGETDYIGPWSPQIMDIVLSARLTRVRSGYENYVQVSSADAAAVYYEDSPEYGFRDGNGGQIFSAGTHCGWGNALLTSASGHETMRRITRNIIQHMVDAPPPPPDFRDLGVLASHWLDECDSPGWCEYADVDMSGTVNMMDFGYFGADWSSD